MLLKSVLLIFGLFFTNSAVKADDVIPPELVQQVIEVKNLTDTLEANGLSLETFLANVSPRLKESDVKLQFYSSADEDGTEVQVSEGSSIQSLVNFNANNPTIFVSHGWQNTITSPVVTNLKSAYFAKNANINFFAVNWDSYAAKDYLSALAAVSDVGKYLGNFIATLSSTYNYDLSKITLVGHSLGAHVCGYAGKLNNGNLGTIVGLDPAGPGFTQNSEKSRLCSSDAKYVQAIHTNGKLLGVNFSVGNSDFWPNGGKTQPGCDADLVGSCAHGRSYAYFAESITSDSFLGKKCDNYDSFTSGSCNGEIREMGGYTIDTSSSGNYYLKTNSASPYGLGSSGTSA